MLWQTDLAAEVEQLHRKARVWSWMLRVYRKVNVVPPNDVSVCGKRLKPAVKAAVWGGGESWRTAAVAHWKSVWPQNPSDQTYYFDIWTGFLRWLLPWILEERILHPLLDNTFHFCMLRTSTPALKMSIMHLLWLQGKCNVSITFLLPPLPSLHLYSSHMCVVTGLCEDCIKFWSQCKPDATSSQQTNKKKLSQGPVELSWHDQMTKISLTLKA